MDNFELIVRKEIFPSWIIYVLLFCLALVLLLKFLKTETFSLILSLFYKKITRHAPLLKELKFASWSNFILLANYFLMSSLFTYMIIIYYESTNYYFVLLPISLYVIQILILFWIGVISGEEERMKEIKIILNLTYYYFGLFLIPIAMAWLLNPSYSSFFISLVFIIFLLLQFLRLIRGIIIAFRNNVTWYYIILYLCNFEILLVVLLYKYLPEDFLISMI